MNLAADTIQYNIYFAIYTTFKDVNHVKSYDGSIDRSNFYYSINHSSVYTILVVNTTFLFLEFNESTVVNVLCQEKRA